MSGTGDESSTDSAEPVPDISTSFDSARDELYERLIAEGNPPQLSITLATLYAEWMRADVAGTMDLLRGLLDQLSQIFGGGEQAGGMLGKLVGKMLKGNG